MDRREFLLKLGRSVLVISAVAFSGKLLSGRSGGLFGASSADGAAAGRGLSAPGAGGSAAGAKGAATVDCAPAWNCGSCASVNNCGLPKRKQYATLIGR
jgi:hypothetical protein